MRSCNPVEGYRHKCFFNSSLPCRIVPHGSVPLQGCPACSDLPKYKHAAPDSSDSLQTHRQFRFSVWCVRPALCVVRLLAQEGRICVRGALPRRYNCPVDPWSCRLADSLLDPSMTLPSVLRVHPLSNLGGARWSQIGLSKVGIALI